MTDYQPAAPPRPRLYRSRDDRVVGGVCGGLGAYLAVDVVIVRIIAVALLVSGSGFLLYLIAWIIVPEAPATAPAASGLDVPVTTVDHSGAASTERGRWLLGGLLIAFGGWLLIRNITKDLLPWLDDVILPMILIAVGSAVIVYAMKK